MQQALGDMQPPAVAMSRAMGLCEWPRVRAVPRQYGQAMLERVEPAARRVVVAARVSPWLAASSRAEAARARLGSHGVDLGLARQRPGWVAVQGQGLPSLVRRRKAPAVEMGEKATAGEPGRSDMMWPSAGLTALAGRAYRGFGQRSPVEGSLVVMALSGPM